MGGCQETAHVVLKAQDSRPKTRTSNPTVRPGRMVAVIYCQTVRFCTVRVVWGTHKGGSTRAMARRTESFSSRSNGRSQLISEQPARWSPSSMTTWT